MSTLLRRGAHFFVKKRVTTRVRLITDWQKIGFMETADHGNLLYWWFPEAQKR